MTSDSNTTISAIGVLSEKTEGVSLTVYHNPHAQIPLSPDLLAKYGVQQFKLGEACQGEIAQWELIGE